MTTGETKECARCGEMNPVHQVFCKKCKWRFVDSYG